MSDLLELREDCLRMRASAPLVHNITNYVAMNFTANVLLAAGASPLMSFCPEEMVDIVSSSDALAVNIGCLDSQLVKAAKIAAATALAAGKPWVLDPVGAGMSGLRTRTAMDLAANYGPSVIRGNASEIIALAEAFGFGTSVSAPHGVDSVAEVEMAVESGESLAAKTGAVVSISGPVDYIIACGGKQATVENGSPLMPRVTAMGCAATALTGAFLAVSESPFKAAHHAMAMMGVCGEAAAKAKGGRGLGSFAVEFMDELSRFNRQ
ncbi:MAG: hydroxyethylthiazole kinase [Bacteroidales bacterium]|nr:hydroxyethylthiazole kinase [Bacteroidales bacterium]